jgi:hypothetical protein
MVLLVRSTLQRSLRRKQHFKQLPLLQEVINAYQFVDLEDAYLICAQHLLKTSAILFYNLFQLGLKPHNFSVIGKCYSTDPSVYFELKNMQQLDVCPTSLSFIADEPFDQEYTKNIRKFLKNRLKKILGSGCKKLIVVDDGGELIQAVNEEMSDEIASEKIQIVGVEQTSSGFVKLEKINISFPVINIARSRLKLNLESVLIGDAIFKSINLAMEAIKLKPKKILILGNGAIGSRVKEKLELHYEVDSFDPNIDRSSISKFDQIDFTEYNLIIGCSGKEVIGSLEVNRLRDKTALVSGSSSDREFCAVNFRREFNKIVDCHEHLNIHGIYLINCGFPVNFSKDYHLVDDDRYQLTRALLLAGILQGYFQRDFTSKFIELDENIQNLINDKFFDIYPTL